jgi:hypothetical protein
MTANPTEKLLPCPFCGSSDLDVDLKGTQPTISCNECGDGHIGIQTSDHFTNEERFNDPEFQFRYEPHYDYGIKGTQRALEVLTERWNTRTPQKDASGLVEALKWYADPSRYENGYELLRERAEEALKTWEGK